MKLHISINGIDLDDYGIVPLEGFLNTILKPAGFKKLATNTNTAFDGVIPIANGNRKRDSRTVTLNFLIRSVSIIDKRRCIERLESALMAGKNDSGVNELFVAELEQCYRLIFDGITSYNGANEEKAIIAVKFTEFCPTPENRVP